MFAAKHGFSLLLIGVLLTPPPGAWSRSLLGRRPRVQHRAQSIRREPETADIAIFVLCAEDNPPVSEEVAGALTAASTEISSTQPDTGAATCGAPLEAQGVLGAAEAAFSSQATDPFDYDDHRLKKSQRKKSTQVNFTPLAKRSTIKSTSDILTAVRVKLVPRLPRLRAAAEPLPRFGSGPCHSIPRPREGTTDLPFQSAALLA